MKNEKKRWARPAEEVKEQLDRQVRFIRASCKAYDDGYDDEALRLATAIHIIVHDGGQISLLTQLKARGPLRFLDTATPDAPGNLLTYHPLVAMRFGQPANGYVPSALNTNGDIPSAQFHRWWDKNIIFDDKAGKTITRKKLVFALRSQDGGSHFDAGLSDPAYVGISRQNSLAWTTTDASGNHVPLSGNPHFVMMRVIAYELEATLVYGGLVAGPLATAIKYD